MTPTSAPSRSLPSVSPPSTRSSFAPCTFPLPVPHTTHLSPPQMHQPHGASTAVGHLFSVQVPHPQLCRIALHEQRPKAFCHQVHATSHCRANTRSSLTRSGYLYLCVLAYGKADLPVQLQNKSDSNISNVPAGHPFISGAALEAEGMKLLHYYSVH
jgi:hypothetical protein